MLGSGAPRSQRSVTVPSLIKWTGSKRSQAPVIFANIPSYRNYYEPFLGGGALLFFAAKPGAVAGDIYKPLVDFWVLVQTDVELVIDNYRLQWEHLQDDLPMYYYKVRDRFNANPTPLDLSFLMRTCVNGIVRFNEAAEFNNSFHLSRPGMKPDRFARIATTWSRAIQGVRFICQDYAETVARAGRQDFVYFDPPYAGNKQRYVADLDIDRFFGVLEVLNTRGVRWALSFDGRRGASSLVHPVPRDLYKRCVFVPSGNSAVGKVLNGRVEGVHEALYTNY